MKYYVDIKNELDQYKKLNFNKVCIRVTDVLGMPVLIKKHDQNLLLNIKRKVVVEEYI